MLKKTARRIKSEIAYYRAILADTRTPRAAKILLGVAVGYLLSPIDLIPDFIPMIGELDDLIIVPALVLLALRFVPQAVKLDARQQVNHANAD